MVPTSRANASPPLPPPPPPQLWPRKIGRPIAAEIEEVKSFFNLSAVSTQVEKMERMLSHQLKSNSRMLHTFKTISRIAHETNKTVEQVIAEKAYLEVLAKADYFEVILVQVDSDCSRY